VAAYAQYGKDAGRLTRQMKKTRNGSDHRK
jgi:hypothetical protein